MGETFEKEVDGIDTTESSRGSAVAAELKGLRAVPDLKEDDTDAVEAPEAAAASQDVEALPPELGLKVGDQIRLNATNEVWQIESIVPATRGERFIARAINIDRDSSKITKDVGELLQRLSEGSPWSWADKAESEAA